MPSDQDFLPPTFPTPSDVLAPSASSKAWMHVMERWGLHLKRSWFHLYVYIHIYIRYIHVQIQFVMYSNTYQLECTHSIFGIVNFANVWCSRHNVKSNTSLGWICLTWISCSEAICCIIEASTSQGLIQGWSKRTCDHFYSIFCIGLCCIPSFGPDILIMLGLAD